MASPNERSDHALLDSVITALFDSLDADDQDEILEEFETHDLGRWLQSRRSLGRKTDLRDAILARGGSAGSGGTLSPEQTFRHASQRLRRKLGLPPV